MNRDRSIEVILFRHTWAESKKNNPLQVYTNNSRFYERRDDALVGYLKIWCLRITINSTSRNHRDEQRQTAEINDKNSPKFCLSNNVPEYRLVMTLTGN